MGSISQTYLHTDFTPVAPKSVRIQSSCQYLFTLLGSTGAKAAHRKLMKLTPDFYITVTVTKEFDCRYLFGTHYLDCSINKLEIVRNKIGCDRHL